LRGFSHRGFTITAPSDTCVIAVCDMIWRPNFETENKSVSYSSVGDATYANSTGFGKMYLGPIAQNRSFVRCVRNFLHINILGQDELTPKMPESESDGKPKNLLEETMKEYNITFQTIKNTLIKEKFENAEKFEKVTDIPSYKQLDLLGRIKEKHKN
jgi:hypothetical protein